MFPPIGGNLLSNTKTEKLFRFGKVYKFYIYIDMGRDIGIKRITNSLELMKRF